MFRPGRLGAGGAVVCVLAWWWSVCRDLGDGGAGALLVDDVFAPGPGGDQGLGGDVVDGAGQPAAGVVDQGDGVVAEQRVGPAGQLEVVGDVSSGLLAGHGGHGVAQGDPLVEAGQVRLVDDQQRDAAALAVLGGDQPGGLGGQGGAAVGGPSAERGDYLVVDAPGPGGRVGEVNQGVAGLVQAGDGGAGRDGLAGADLARDHGEGAFAGAPGDPGDGLGVAGVVVQHGRREVLAERGAGEPVVVTQVDHDWSSEVVTLAAASAAARAPAAAWRAVSMSWLVQPLAARSAAMRSSRDALAVR